MCIYIWQLTGCAVPHTTLPLHQLFETLWEKNPADRRVTESEVLRHRRHKFRGLQLVEDKARESRRSRFLQNLVK